MLIGVYPGTFDPLTNGHLDIIERSLKLVDELYVIVPINPNKKTLFSIDERLDQLKEVLKIYPNVHIASTNDLTVNFAKSVNATVMLRGLRAVSDFEYELQLATVNKKIAPDIETIFVMSTNEYSFISSSIVKELAEFKGDYAQFVPESIAKALKEKFN